MRFISRTIFPKRGLAFGALVLATLIGLSAFGFVRGRTDRSLIARGETGNRAPTLVGNLPATTLEVEHVTLRATGFEPNEITRPAGRFLLAVDNRAEKGEMSFSLVRQNGSRERDLVPKHDKFRLRQVLELAPGPYALVVANHPEWICRIAITAP